MSDTPGDHVPVMVEQVVELLAPQPGQVILDCTVGDGGHAAAILPHLAPGGRYIGLDVDPEAIRRAGERRVGGPVRPELVRSNFIAAATVLKQVGVGAVDGLLADLGVSSPQLAAPDRGFSFSRDEPLDMRLDPDLSTTAADLLRRLEAKALADLIRANGEERWAGRIARKIVAARRRRPITTTGQLAALCKQAYPRGRSRIHPATRTFQALRIAVNAELDHLALLLDEVPRLLRPGGRVVLLAFHSLEDRLVKQAFRRWAVAGQAERLTPKPLRPDADERAANRRSRSAKCRAVIWKGVGGRMDAVESRLGE